jgi:hypothetical protein
MRDLGGIAFFASHFDNFLSHPQTLTTLPFSFLYEIIGHGSLRIESDDSLFDFIRKGTETNPKMFCLLEFVRFEYYSTYVMNDLFDVLWENSYDINASIWANICARLVLPNMNKIPASQFPPSVKKAKARDLPGKDVETGVPDGIIAHLTRECSGNVHNRHVVEVTYGSFEK